MTECYLLAIEETALLPQSFCEAHFPKRLEQAHRFRFREDTLRSLGAGALLYGVLHIKESDIQYGEFGKPYVLAERKFNLSHSGDYSVLAVRDGEIGVDIEKPDERHLSLAKRVFDQEEQEWMAEDPRNRFFVLWTLKESVMKFFGKGLGLSPASFSVLNLAKSGKAEIFNRQLFGSSLEITGHWLSVCTEEPVEQVIPKIILAKDLTI